MRAIFMFYLCLSRFLEVRNVSILLTGYDGSRGISKVYRNDGGAFVDISASLAGASSSSVEWGDYDNDGDLDILLTGNGVSKLYGNQDGRFVDIFASLPGVYVGSVAWGDYDNDRDLDILLTGNAPPMAHVLRNDVGVFVDIPTSLTGVGFSSVAWGDYDSDGDLDILLQE